MADETMMFDDSVELEELPASEGVEEVSEEDLGEVTGGRAANIQMGAFTTRREAELFAESKFKVGYCYNLKGKRVKCISTGAEYYKGYWYAVCYYSTGSGTGKASISSFR